MFNIQDELKKLPDRPGVYLMHDSSDEIIYIGEAQNLQKRFYAYGHINKLHNQNRYHS